MPTVEEEKTRDDRTSQQVLAALRQIIRSIDIHSKYLARTYGLTGPQLVILRAIQTTQDKTVGAIAHEVSLSQATVTSVLDRLEQKGLIERVRSKLDKRKVMVHTTTAADALLQHNPTVMQGDFVRRFRRLKEWEQTLILSSVQRLADMMQTPAIAIDPGLDGTSPGDELIWPGSGDEQP